MHQRCAMFCWAVCVFRASRPICSAGCSSHYSGVCVFRASRPICSAGCSSHYSGVLTNDAIDLRDAICIQTTLRSSNIFRDHPNGRVLNKKFMYTNLWKLFFCFYLQFCFTKITRQSSCSEVNKTPGAVNQRERHSLCSMPLYHAMMRHASQSSTTVILAYGHIHLSCTALTLSLCCLVIRNLSKDIQCHVWPYSSQKISYACKSPVQTADHTGKRLSAWWLQTANLSSSKVCVGMYGLTCSLCHPWKPIIGSYSKVMARERIVCI